MVMMTAQVTQTWEHIFRHDRDKDGWSIEDKHLYNLDTIRIRREGGDTSKRWLFMSYFGTTIRMKEEVSCWRTPSLVWKPSTCACVCNSMLTWLASLDRNGLGF